MIIRPYTSVWYPPSHLSLFLLSFPPFLISTLLPTSHYFYSSSHLSLFLLFLPPLLISTLFPTSHYFYSPSHLSFLISCTPPLSLFISSLNSPILSANPVESPPGFQLPFITSLSAFTWQKKSSKLFFYFF